jgi:hypothetical protein
MSLLMLIWCGLAFHEVILFNLLCKQIIRFNQEFLNKILYYFKFAFLGRHMGSWPEAGKFYQFIEWE